MIKEYACISSKEQPLISSILALETLNLHSSRTALFSTRDKHWAQAYKKHAKQAQLRTMHQTKEKS
jgi:hypothetical protein